MPPALLLTFTFVLGSGSVISLPAYQSLIPTLVPRNQISAASTLGSISVNVARAIGPAIAGVLIARIGVGAVFAINAAAFLTYAIVVAAWHPNAQTSSQLPERFVSALRAGGRYVRYAPVIRRMLLRTALFLVPGSALWALLPLVATQRLHMNASGYGLLLGALGVGAVAGSFLLGQLRRRLTPNLLLVASSLVYAVVMVVVVLVPNIVVAVLALLPAGFAWMAVLSTMNASVQLFLPEWVRARGLSVYLTVLFGSQAIGAVLWGVIAAPKGVLPAFLIAAALMIVGPRRPGSGRSSIPRAWTGEPSRDPSRSSRSPPSPRGTDRGPGHLHDLAGPRSCIPGGDGPRPALTASHRRDAVGTLPRW